jgi:hypothetical protein
VVVVVRRSCLDSWLESNPCHPATLEENVGYIMVYIEPDSIVFDYGLDDRGSIPDRGRGFFLSSLRPDRLWGPPNFLYSGYRGLFPRG